MLGSIKLSLFCICCVFVFQAPAQTSSLKSPEKPASEKKKPSVADTSALPDEVAKFRRVTAIALITSLADEARDYGDESLRVNIQARAAQALWNTDHDRALSLFQRAWETAAVLDRAAQQRSEEDRKAFLSGRGEIGLIPSPKNLRLQVLRFAARCDRELAEKFLAQIEEEKKSVDSDTAVNSGTFETWDPTEPPLAISQRLDLANLLLDTGEVEKALRVADPALERVTKPGIFFLYKLRQTNSSAADQRFSAQLMRTAADPLADANSISLLSTYAFTPLVFATVTRKGRMYGGEAGPIPNLANDLRASFFRVAAQVLLRPITDSTQDRTSAGREGTYFVISRLLPLFEKYAPEKIPELNSYLTALTQYAPESLRNDYTMRTVGFNSEPPAIDDVEVALAQVKRASSSGERDRIYLTAIHTLLKTNAARARQLAEKIENLDLKNRCLALVDFIIIKTALEQKNTEAVLRLVRAGTLPSIQKVWAYTEVAHLVENDSFAALQILGEATAEAGRIDQQNPERVQAFTAVATRAFEIDRARAWEIMSEVVKAASHATDFQGEAARLTVELKTGTMVTMFNVEVPSFDLSSIFSSLAREDLQRAIDLAKAFPTTEPRAIAIFAIARSVLEEKPAAKQ